MSYGYIIPTLHGISRLEYCHLYIESQLEFAVDSGNNAFSVNPAAYD